MTNWDDLRYFLAAVRAGTLAGAARELGVNPTTVARRLEALEESLGSRILERGRGVLSPSALGRETLERVAGLEQTVLELERRASGEDAKLQGRVRITTTETFASWNLIPSLSEFHERYPGLELEILTDNRELDLSRRQAEVAVRLVRPKQSSLVSRKVTRIAVATYGSASYLAKRGTPNPKRGFAGHAFVGYSTSASGWPEAKWLNQRLQGADVPLRVDSVAGLAEAAAAGLGLALLPCFVGDAHRKLRRVLPPDPDLEREVFLVIHQDLQQNAKVRAVLEFLRQAIAQRAPAFRGDAPA